MPIIEDTSRETQFVATLTRGNRYALRDKVFERGVEVLVSAAERAHLEEHAVDIRIVPGFDPDFDDEEERSESISKFIFRDHVEGESINTDINPNDAPVRTKQPSRTRERTRTSA